MLLNLDAGELESETEELWSLFDLLACACGGHTGDADSMTRVAEFCARSGIRLGAHPSYPDREGFGRRSIAMVSREPRGSMTITADELRQSIVGQCAALSAIAASAGVAVMAVKPHGALYHEAARDPAIANLVLDALAMLAVDRNDAIDSGRGITIIGPPRGALFEAAQRRGVRYLREGFADRRMRADGSLVPRSEPDALITEPSVAARQARSLDVDTICVHADTPGAIEIARAVREALRG